MKQLVTEENNFISSESNPPVKGKKIKLIAH